MPQLKRVNQMKNVNKSMCRCDLIFENSYLKKKQTQKLDGLVEGAANQSINGLGLDQIEKSFFQEQDQPKAVDKTKLWMDFDDFFICFKYNIYPKVNFI